MKLTLAAVISVKSRMALTLSKDASPMSVAPVNTTLRQLLQKLTKLTRNEECEGVTWEFWGTSTTLCSSPSSLYTETNQWPSSMKKLGRRRTSFCNRWQLIWNRKGELSKFLHLKVLESVKLGLSCFDVLSLQIFPKLAYIALGIIFSQKLSWNPFKRVKTSWWCSTI